MIIYRLISYEGEPEEIDRQLSQSLPDGHRQVNASMMIRVVTLPENFARLFIDPAKKEGKLF